MRQLSHIMHARDRLTIHTIGARVCVCIIYRTTKNAWIRFANSAEFYTTLRTSETHTAFRVSVALYADFEYTLYVLYIHT